MRPAQLDGWSVVTVKFSNVRPSQSCAQKPLFDSETGPHGEKCSLRTAPFSPRNVSPFFFSSGTAFERK